MFVKKIQFLSIFILIQIIITNKQNKPNNTKPNNTNQNNNTKPNNTNQNNQSNNINKTTVSNITSNLTNEKLLFPLENDTINIRGINDTLIFYMNYNFKKKKFIRIILILLSSIIFLSLIYSLYKVPLKIRKPINCSQRTKYFCKSLTFIFFFPLTSIYYLLNSLFSFLDGVFPDNFEDEVLRQTEVSINKKMTKIL